MKFVLIDLLKSLYNKNTLYSIILFILTLIGAYFNIIITAIVLVFMMTLSVIARDKRNVIISIPSALIVVILLIAFINSKPKNTYIGDINLLTLSSKEVREYNNSNILINTKNCSIGTHKIYKSTQKFYIFEITKYNTKCNEIKLNRKD